MQQYLSDKSCWACCAGLTGRCLRGANFEVGLFWTCCDADLASLCTSGLPSLSASCTCCIYSSSCALSLLLLFDRLPAAAEDSSLWRVLSGRLASDLAPLRKAAVESDGALCWGARLRTGSIICTFLGGSDLLIGPLGLSYANRATVTPSEGTTRSV